nr:MAG TPA: hypothetical protein [Bacteriophage sp.]
MIIFRLGYTHFSLNNSTSFTISYSEHIIRTVIFHTSR